MAQFSRAQAKKFNTGRVKRARARMKEAGGSVGEKYRQRKAADTSISRQAGKSRTAMKVRTKHLHSKAMQSGKPVATAKNLERRTRTAAADPVLRKLKQQKQLRKSGRGYSRYS